jgi:hypothetical protein
MKPTDNNREEKIRLHCSALAAVIVAIRPIYSSVSGPQKALLETMIGAAIWYIPKPQDAWTGKISRKALERLHPDNPAPRFKLSEEHVYPRKVAACMLLRDTALTSQSMEIIFREQYGRLHYITPEENKAVIRFQKFEVFSSPEEAYRKAGIELIDIAREDLRSIKKRDRISIEKYINRNEANQAVEPTTMLVTDPANAGSAPSMVAAHF